MISPSRLLAWTLLLASLAGPSAAPALAARYTLVGWNNLGMHCMDGDYSVLSLLPPYNTIHAQLVSPTGDLVDDPAAAGITVTYRAVADPTGAINTTSLDKTNFWMHVDELFGASLPVDAGLAGFAMPGAANTPRAMKWDATQHWFVAEGIPITPYDDQGHKNYYPMMRLEARSSTGALLASTDIVLPVSDEMSCSTCHSSTSGPAAKPARGWSDDPNPERALRLSILRLHDERQAVDPRYAPALAAAGYEPAGLEQTALDGTAILCASCHLSEALPGSGQAGIPALTSAIHGRHATVTDPQSGLTLDASANRSACYRCHPGSVTRCLRGAMGSAVASDGSLAMQCQSCHGSMSAVGDPDRTGWLDEPACQNCHSGTATKNSGQIRFTSALDASGARRIPADPRFATSANAPAPGLDLYRFSTGHGGLKCESCHGSTHAEFPASHPNDNLQSIALQGHAGTLAECTSCHPSTPSTIDGGPHGMHPVGQVWVQRHHDVVENGGAAVLAQCRSCHGADDRGTVLSRAQADRVLDAGELGTKTIWRGFQIGCYGCHRGAQSDDRNPNRAAVVSDATGTSNGAPVQIALAASDADGNPLTLRIVAQPAHGTTGLAGTIATYYPEPGYAGSDQFTFAAWDGSTDSNLGTVRLSVTGTPPPSGPDLVASWLTEPVQVCTTRCSLRTGRALFRNTGDQIAGATRARFYLSDDATLDASDVLLRERGIAKVRPGHERTKNLGTIQLDPGVSALGKHVIVVADATGLVGESNEGNNSAASIAIAAP
ncbi:hypothetical protein K2Z84_20745 [Candidatus Binatia bacterium]|nr:hypothetical protein [Candidatus Binatia bacterium]